MGEMRGEKNAEAVSPEVLLVTVLSFCGIGLGLGAAVLGISVLAVLGIFMLLSVLFLCFLYLRKRVDKVTWLLYLIGIIGTVSGIVISIEPLWIGIASPFFTELGTILLLSSGFFIMFASVRVAYHIHKYFNLMAEFQKYEKPYGHEREKVESEDIPYYYKVLGVSKDASQEEIKRAYYRLVRIYHPDVSADPEARRKFEEIRKAYEVLSDPEKRAKYDKFEHAYRSGRY